MIKLKFSELNSFNFTQTVAKIIHSVTDGHRSYEIGKLGREIHKAQKEVRELYRTEIIEKYGAKDEKGQVTVATMETQDEFPEGFKVKEEEGIMDQLRKAQSEFGDNEVELNFRPWTTDTLRDVKLAGADLMNLGPCYDWEGSEKESAAKTGPGVPNGGAQHGNHLSLV